MTQKTALVTGATSGIGLATAEQLVAAGFVVFGTGRDLERVPTDRGVRAVQLDVTDETSMRSAVDRVVSEAGSIDVLVNNAGYGLNGFLEDLPIEEIRSQFEVNVFGLIRMTQLVAPIMRAAGGGRIIHVGSVGGIITAPGAGAYHASKFALEAISDVHRMELAPFGIDVTLIQPTGVDTPFLDKVQATYPGTTATSPYAEAAERSRQQVRVLARDTPRFLVIPPEKVGAAITKQATKRRPRTRVRVGASARLLARVRRTLPDRTWDRLATSAMN